MTTPVRQFQGLGNSLRHKARGNRQKLIVPDGPHHIVQREVRGMDVFCSAAEMLMRVDAGKFNK
jgi:hypothetical protein